MWIKDNAVAIAAIIAALGTISGFLIKASSKVKTHAVKLGENVKERIHSKKPAEEKKEENNSEEEKKEPTKKE